MSAPSAVTLVPATRLPIEGTHCLRTSAALGGRAVVRVAGDAQRAGRGVDDNGRIGDTLQRVETLSSQMLTPSLSQTPAVPNRKRNVARAPSTRSANGPARRVPTVQEE